MSAPRTERLRFERFEAADVEALAALLADPELSRNITTNGSTPERCRASAEARIEWHNSAWDSAGYGVWALREASAELGGKVVGWCGFGAPDVPSEGPEILYGLARDLWGVGLGSEAARGAIDWLFAETNYPEVSALIFSRLNPGSLRIAEKLGMSRRGVLPFKDFLSSEALARDVLDYEIWRLREGACLDLDALLFQAPFKAGQIASLGIADREATQQALVAAAQERTGARPGIDHMVMGAFHEGLGAPWVDWYCVTREAWHGP